MRIGFDIGIASLRGTHVAIYDYALHNQSILGNESIVFYQISDKQISEVLNKFKQQFQLVAYDSLDQLNNLASQLKVDRFYLIKSGENDSYRLPSIPNLVHAVFPQNRHQRHGNVYAFVSRWLSMECSNGLIPYVPHMISLPKHEDNLRGQLSISQNSLVFGYYGGSDSFNLGFVKELICEIVHKNRNIYFLFMNIPSFLEHPQAIFLPGSTDLNYKAKFINTVDAMIHARGIGESFGIACGEFSILNKPIMTYELSPQRSHLEILGSKALLYRGPRELEQLIMGFDQNWARSQDWDCYSKEFSPQAVMNKFDSVFIKPDIVKPAPINYGFNDLFNIQLRRLTRKGRSLSRKYHLYIH